jgi:hypothetical protein
MAMSAEQRTRACLRQITVLGTGDSVQCRTGGDDAVIAMKALILYVVFVTIGGVISAGIGYYVEKEFSSTASLIVFLALFFSNFAVSWIAVILAIDGSLNNAQGAQEQLDIEKAGRAGIATREANATAARAAKAAAAAPNARPAD